MFGVWWPLGLIVGLFERVSRRVGVVALVWVFDGLNRLFWACGEFIVTSRMLGLVFVLLFR